VVNDGEFDSAVAEVVLNLAAVNEGSSQKTEKIVR